MAAPRAVGSFTPGRTTGVLRPGCPGERALVVGGRATWEHIEPGHDPLGRIGERAESWLASWPCD